MLSRLSVLSGNKKTTLEEILMYRIGQFSKITKVTIKALRFYEEEGLLEPCFVDAVNGYRYYDSDQLQRMFKIVALKQCGFSIPDIRQIIVGKNLASLVRGKKERTGKTGQRDLDSDLVDKPLSRTPGKGS